VGRHGQGGAAKRSDPVTSAILALVRELTGSGVYYLPVTSAVEIARIAFQDNIGDTANSRHRLDVAMSCIWILEQNLARGRKVGILDWAAPRTEPGARPQGRHFGLGSTANERTRGTLPG
jgi:hypothetical protein